jgi:hypothetical protein
MIIQDTIPQLRYSLGCIPVLDQPRPNRLGWSITLPRFEDLVPRSDSSEMFDDFEQNGSDDYDYVEPSDDSFVGSAPTPDDSLDVASIERSVVELQELRSDQVIIDIGSSSNSSCLSESDSDEYAIPLVAYDAYNPNNDFDNEDEETESYSEESSFYETDENEEDFSIEESDEDDDDDDDEDTQLVTEEFYNKQVAIRIESTSDESISSPERNVTIENVATGGNNEDELFRLVERKMVLAQFQMPIKKPSTPNEVHFLSKKSR